MLAGDSLGTPRPKLVDNIQRILDISNVGLAAFSELSYFATDSQVSQNVRFGLEPPPPLAVLPLSWLGVLLCGLDSTGL